MPSEGTSLVYAQHQWYLDKKKEEHNLCIAILEDLAIKMRKWRKQGDCVILGMDTNQGVQIPSLRLFFKIFGMREVILE
jgi:hypothetical protein